MCLDDIERQVAVASSGLRIQAVRLDHAHSAVISAQLNVGSRFETPSNNGVSHFLEHMLYRGTPTFPTAHALARAFESSGGTLVASTSVDTGVMALRVPPANQRKVLGVFAEVFRDPVFSGIEIERGIVIEEILEGLDDDGGSIDADNAIRALAFRDHPLGMPITGTADHVRGFSVDALRRHLSGFYTADNTVVTVVGPLPAALMLEQVEEAFVGLPRGSVPAVQAPAAPQGPSFDSVRHSSSQTEVRVGFHGPGYRTEDEPVMEVIMRLLDDGMSTRLYHRICDERGLCYDVSGGYETYADCGLVEFAAGSVHDRAPEVLEQILNIVVELRDEGPSPEEIELVQRRHRWQFEQMLDSPDAIADYLGVEALTGPVRLTRERQAQIDVVTAADVQRIAAKYFTPSNLHVVAVGAMKRQDHAKVERLISKFS